MIQNNNTLALLNMYKIIMNINKGDSRKKICWWKKVKLKYKIIHLGPYWIQATDLYLNLAHINSYRNKWRRPKYLLLLNFKCDYKTFLTKYKVFWFFLNIIYFIIFRQPKICYNIFQVYKQIFFSNNSCLSLHAQFWRNKIQVFRKEFYFVYIFRNLCYIV